MPSKMATCCKEKAVLVAVYVEKPRRRKLISKQSNGHNQQHHHHHHHHHHYHHLRQVKRGSNRRADLLNYSQRLRESAKSGASSPNHHPKPAPPVVSTTKQIGPPQGPQPVATLRQLGPPQPMAKIIPSPSKTKQRKGPSCMDWKVIVPKLLKSMAMCQAKKEVKKKKMKMKKGGESASTKAKAIMKSFKGPKKGGFLSKLLATIQKYR